MNAVPLPHENKCNALAHYRAAIFFECYVVLKISNPPGFGSGARDKDAEENRTDSNCLRDFQITEYPITNASELDLDRLAICRRRLEELPLRESEHARDQIGGKRLDLSIQVAYHGVVIAP